jgi:hypothetical protein
MKTALPNLRTNLATWAVPVDLVPAVTEIMLESLPAEDYDPAFKGQHLETIYFDTQKLELRKNRRAHDQYITVRVRCYDSITGDAYALSAKTEQEKFHLPIDERTAEHLISGDDPGPALATLLPGHLLARLLDVSHSRRLMPVVKIMCRRYAREDDRDRLTLDLCVRTDTGKRLPYGVLEFKSINNSETFPDLLNVPIRPMKLSKFLWSLEV